MIAGLYSGDSGHAKSSGSFTLNVRSSQSGQPKTLSFIGIDVDDFDHGVGQLQVQVNGQLVVDIPAGLNHLSGSGDFATYTGESVQFGPFDITSFVIQGQNIVTFLDPSSSLHFGGIRDVTILQGNTVLLHVHRFAAVFPDHSVTYTFSNPPLVLTSFTVSTANPTSDQGLTFTASYAGGTGPFTCIFFFEDGERAAVNGTATSCSTVHDFDSSGTFHSFVIVKGASTSDVIVAHLSITVADS